MCCVQERQGITALRIKRESVNAGVVMTSFGVYRIGLFRAAVDHALISQSLQSGDPVPDSGRCRSASAFMSNRTPRGGRSLSGTELLTSSRPIGRGGAWSDAHTRGRRMRRTNLADGGLMHNLTRGGQVVLGHVEAAVPACGFLAWISWWGCTGTWTRAAAVVSRSRWRIYAPGGTALRAIAAV